MLTVTFTCSTGEMRTGVLSMARRMRSATARAKVAWHDGSTTQLWAERADQQLYLAKQAGRNCIVLEEPPDSTVSAEEKNMLFAPLFTPSDWGELPPLDPPGSVN